jgi:hypothetical protein
MSAKRVSKGPVLDGKAFVKPLAAAHPTSTGGVRPVYGSTPDQTTDPFPATLRWLRGDGEFDGHGKSVADTINGNADFTNAIKADVDEHADRLAKAEKRLALLEATPPTRFP